MRSCTYTEQKRRLDFCYCRAREISAQRTNNQSSQCLSVDCGGKQSLLQGRKVGLPQCRDLYTLCSDMTSFGNVSPVVRNTSLSGCMFNLVTRETCKTSATRGTSHDRFLEGMGQPHTHDHGLCSPLRSALSSYILRPFLLLFGNS